MYLRYRVAELKRNAKVFDTLHDVSRKSGGERHKFAHKLDLSAFKRKAACHYEPDIARTKDNNLFSGKIAVNVDETLYRARRKNTRRT